MIVAILTETTLDDALTAVCSLPDEIEAIEWRLDFLIEIDHEQMSFIREQIKKPLILTLRSTKQGGHYQGNEKDRLALLHTYAQLNPTYVDLEANVDPTFIHHFHTCHPSIQIVRSYHDFKETPHDLDMILSKMKHACVSHYKLITYAENTLDNFRIVHFIKKHTNSIKLSAHCMGPLGLPSRLIGAMMGNFFHYAVINEQNSPAPYCPSVATLLTIYRLHKINEHTQCFALLGDPIEHSIGHLFHNRYFSDNDINALYLKIRLTPDELPIFFKQIKGLPFKGLSVTMPLKEKIFSYLDFIDPNAQKIEAINTVMIHNDQLHGTNTDGLGALDALQKRTTLLKKHILIIGAGGAAKAIAHECALKKPLSLTFLNRTLDKANALAKKTNGSAYNYDSFKTGTLPLFDIVVITLPKTTDNEDLIFQLIRPYLSKKTIVMGIDYSKPNGLFDKKINTLGCVNIPPKEMFENQALHQLNYWKTL